MNTKHFINNNRQIRYEFRSDCGLIIFVDFDTRIPLLADSLEKCSQVKQANRIERYDDKTGCIILKLIKGYSETETIKELESVFNLFT